MPRLLEKHRPKRSKGAVEIALELGCPRKELIGQHLHGEHRVGAVFQLDDRDHLKVMQVDGTDPGDYRSLLERLAHRVRIIAATARATATSPGG